MANRSKVTPEKRDAFLDQLRQHANVTVAARFIGISRREMYREREGDDGMADAWDEAVQEGLDMYEREVARRAFEGVDEPVFYQGEVCGHVRKASDTLAMFFLKGHRPERFKERQAHEHTGKDGGPIETEIAGAREFIENALARLEDREQEDGDPGGDER